jgi:DNA-directed RNA polymerase subunit omega
MAEPRSTMIDPPIESLLDKVDSKFTLVTLASKRARQINSYFNQLGEGLGAIVPPQVTSLARKPLSISLEEIAAGKVRAGFPIDETEVEVEVVEAEEGSTAPALVEVIAAVEPAADEPAAAEPEQ